MMVAGMMVMVVMVLAAGKGRNRNHNEGDEQEWQKLFHAPDYSHAYATQNSSKAKRTSFGNRKLAPSERGSNYKNDIQVSRCFTALYNFLMTFRRFLPLDATSPTSSGCYDRT